MQKKRGFTLIEVLIVIFVFATGVMIVVQGVNKTTGYISEMTQRTIAMNLAKEGIEAMYNIRNTNWRKRSSEKDKCWLAMGTGNQTNNTKTSGCDDWSLVSS